MIERLPNDVAIVIPAFNEALRIQDIARAARAICDRVLVIDDASTDATVAEAEAAGAEVIERKPNGGKGAALRTGFAAALAGGAQRVITMDGDGQHDPADALRLVAASDAYPDAVIVGARLRSRAAAPWPRRMANAFGDWGIAFGCGYRLVDSQSGFRLYPAAVAALQDVPGEGFVFEAQMLIHAARRAGARVVAVPIETRYAGLTIAPMRASHFRPLRDLWLITSQVAVTVVRQGNFVPNLISTRRTRPIVVEPGATDAAQQP